MPTTRSATRTVTNSAGDKRKLDQTSPPKSSQKRPRVPKAVSTPATPVSVPGNVVQTNSSSCINAQDSQEATTLLPAVLTFSFEDARQHLIRVDHRFEDLFSKMTCKPFEHLEQVHPFRALVTSILGQQISWLAARSINHRFVRLYDSSLPEKPTDYEAVKSSASFFPSPEQVSKTDIPTLKTAGLSTRKAEYIQDLASRFADGRLSTQKLVNANDDELAQMLIEVRGIGRWTVDMFAIFSLRRPDILPVGDLGVQRGLVRWFLSLHSPFHNYSISPEKVGGQSITKKTTKKGQKGKEGMVASTTSNEDELPIFGNSFKPAEASTSALLDTPLPVISSVLPAISGDGEPDDGGMVTIPPAFTPSIKKTLDKPAVDTGFQPVPLPPGIEVGLLKSRLDGKKKIKGAFLTPKEMEDLTECWKPYRSLGVYYMWSLADVTE